MCAQSQKEHVELLSLGHWTALNAYIENLVEVDEGNFNYVMGGEDYRLDGWANGIRYNRRRDGVELGFVQDHPKAWFLNPNHFKQNP